ncbi:FCD domain-containing protein [Vibrio algarum]|uniref:GntR family transcriptional regulator n=1 Tax=Vibrio algarum TaxID=3020714 RepID=A0ABT4YWT6_9VIBR|nr:FCD domain-containing protein [Vibrio sp. KJ40-1]MDB1125852.1 GntR family transcriptional regulator [Vibrio sp. KJ40-1]
MTNTKRLYQQIGQKLKDKIAAGDFKVGEKLPPEREIAEQMEVSRSVIRESLIMLELQNIVKVRKGSGVFVINTPDDAQKLMKEQQKLEIDAEDDDDVGPFEMLQARQFLESRIAEFAAAQVTKSDISKLREALDMERKHLDDNCLDYDGDEMFHIVIAEATQNSVLCDMVKELWVRREKSSMWRQLHERISNQDYRRRWLADHEKIYRALVRKDPTAAREAMWLHLENVKQTLFDLSDVDDPKFDGFLFNSYPVTN